MSQTGYTPIQLYRTTTSGAAPTAGNLTDGELAININDADVALYTKNQSGVVKRLMNNPASLKYPTVDGTSNQVIKTDGAGLLSWVTAVLSGGALGTPTSGTLTNCTGLPVSTGVSGLGTNVATFLQTPTSANLAAALTDKTGTGANVFASNPTFPAQINLTANSGYNIYASGTADNYLAGRLGVGVTCGSDTTIQAGRALTGGTAQWGVYHTGVVNSDVTVNAAGFRNVATTQAASFTLNNYLGFIATQGTLGAGSAITNQYGFFAENSLTGATNNYGFYGTIASGTGRYNLYMAGTADNYLGGSLGIGTSSPVYTLDVSGAIRANIPYSQIVQSCSMGGITTGGYIRFTSNGAGKYNYQINTAAAGDFTTVITAYTIDASGNVGIGTASPNASAILDVQSTTKGVRMPNMTTTQKLAIASPAAGLMVFDTTLSKLCVYSGAAWQTITSI
jgi:hypothetical protein